ncbi:MAG: GlsB/YeaQ/YmgE family stress response membrane protein [Myxococcota bacterium]
MSAEAILIILLVGAIAGWLASVIVTNWGFGLVINIIIGILGGLLGSWLFPKLGIVIGSGILGSILNATLGAIIILIVAVGFQRVGFFPRRRL